MELPTRTLASGSALLLLAAAGIAASGASGYALIAFLAGGIAGCAAAITFDPRRGALATALWCAGANAYLFSHKLASAGPSICNLNQVVNCDLVNSSAASEMLGVPITLLGLAFYTGLALAASIAGPLATTDSSRENSRFDQVNTLFAIVNVGYSAWLAYQSELIGAVCVVCVSIYLGNLLLLWSGLAALRRQGVALLDEAGALPLSSPSATIAGVFLVITLIGASVWRGRAQGPQLVLNPPTPTPTPAPGPDQPSPPAPAPETPDVSAIYHLPRGTVTTTGKEPTLGSKNPRYTLLEYADFGCPHCAHAFGEIHQLIDENPDVQLRFRVFPLTGACNPALPNDSGPERCFAALAAVCAGRQGKFFEMAGKLFENQVNFYHGNAYQPEPTELVALADAIGLDETAWDACMQDPATLQEIQADAVAGAQTGLEGTPTFFLQGVQGNDWIEVAAGPAAVAQIIAAARSGAQLPPAPPAPIAGL